MHKLKLTDEKVHDTDYDWTFSTDYCGSTSSGTRASPDEAATPTGRTGAGSASPGAGVLSFIESSFSTKAEYEAWLCRPESDWRAHEGSGIDMALLRRRDIPILHSVDIPLFQTDLDDNGESEVRLRLRVMPSCFFLLLRHNLRVDGLLIRQHDTRVFHKFGTHHVVRARRLGEAPLEPLPVESKLPKAPDARGSAPWSAAMPPLGSASLPDEHQAAERLAMRPPMSESVEELLLA